MEIRRAGGDLPQITDDQQAQMKEQLVQQVDAQIVDMIESAGAESTQQAQSSSGSESVGTVRQALTTGGETKIPNEDSMPNYDQGTSNGCGTTSLAMIMTYLGVPQTKESIDAIIRRFDVFTSPGDLIEFARDNGLAAEGYNNGSWEELKSFIDRGLPCQALIDVSGEGNVGKLHYIAVTGYGTDPKTGEEYIIYHDPATGAEETMPRAEFEKKWAAPPGGFENYFIAYGPAGTALPPGRDEGIEGALALTEGITNVTNNFNRLVQPDSFGNWFHGLIGLGGGVVQTIGGAIGGAVSLAGQWMYDGVEGIPVIENIVQPFAGLVDTAGAAFSDVVNGFGEAFDSWGGAFESLFEGDVGGFFEGLGEGIGDVVGGVVDAVGDVVEGIGDAVSDFFSGW